MILKPQPGPQTQFLSSSADIVIFGGAAGGGKTMGLLLEPLRHIRNPNFGAVIFRRNAVQIKSEGGLWDTASDIYPSQGLIPTHEAKFIHSHGSRVGFRHLDMDKTVLSYQGAQIPLIGFDELTHFTSNQFTYMLARNRSTCGVKPYIRATTNPDPDSWVKKWIDWWIDSEGFPIPQRSGVIRWFLRIEDELMWANTKEELIKQFGEKKSPKSFTFIPSRVQDNKILLEKDPNYLANLEALPRVLRMQLLYGNWNAREAAGEVFKKEWFEIIDHVPGNVVVSIRYWDRAATEENSKSRDPDYTVGAKISLTADGLIIVEDIVRFRGTPHKVKQRIKNTASLDGHECWIGLEQDPGQAGKFEIAEYVKDLLGYTIKVNPVRKDKLTRARPASAQAEMGQMKLLRGSWNDAFLNELEGFPDASHDDQVDGLSGALQVISKSKRTLRVRSL